jgi:hypothetical protein
MAGLEGDAVVSLDTSHDKKPQCELEHGLAPAVHFTTRDPGRKVGGEANVIFVTLLAEMSSIDFTEGLLPAVQVHPSTTV